ncbi:hypothetical protein BTA51_07040 [Hahella sp. CCB-MM4]|uniref:M48 family metallopeptidase n=1 Tax=Hahella sp. (strain CCB-MM4) TaxID=1926491 RepID=UPI000B9A8980|nr:M48 family metallopeptidase [Hahella sp. CCB-MM4]OZG74723.1 hypothetical protein BTA51_07040 [Hahella sp. CCB-MM4]
MEGNSASRYFVRSAGAADRDPETIVSSLIRHLNVTEAQAIRIIAQPVMLKKQLTEEQARRYVKVLGKIGLLAEMHPHSPETKQHPLSDSPKAAEKTDIRQQRAETRELVELFQQTFRQPIHQLPVTLTYKLGLISVMLISLVAPTIYFSLVLGSVYVTCSYAVYLLTLFDHKTPNFFLFIAYLIPIVIGIIFTLFLAKPFFTREEESPDLLLDRSRYKRFYRLIELLAERMGIPAPVAIYVNDEVNASVAPEKGLFSLVQGKLVLTVGLPLVAGLNSRQFLGIIAHEFGHFTQRNAMFASQVINNVNAWMWDCAFGEDNWDRRLKKWSEYSPVFVVEMGIFLCRNMILATRWLMKYMYLFNLRTTCWMSREMEYDADRYGSLVAGSCMTREISEAIRCLIVGRQQSEQLWRATWNDSRLPDSLPHLAAILSSQLTSEQRQHIAEEMDKQQTEVWDTHPANNDRIAMAEATNFEGIWQHDFPAAKLMPCFDLLCKTMTLRIYSQEGLKDVEKALAPSEQILQLEQKQKAVDKAVSQYLRGMYSPRIIKLRTSAADPMSLEDARTQYLQNLKKIEAQLELFWQTVEKCRSTRRAMGYLEAGFSIDNEDFGLKAGTLDAAQSHYQEWGREFKELQDRLSDSMDRLLSNRIAVAIDLMESGVQSKAIHLRQTLVQLRQANSIWFELPELIIVLDSLLREQGTEGSPDGLEIAINQYAQYGKEILLQFSHIAKGISVHLETQEQQSLLDFANGWDIDVENLEGLDPVSIYRLLDGCRRVLNFISYRTLGELAALCLSVEASHQLLDEAESDIRHRRNPVNPENPEKKENKDIQPADENAVA